MTFFSAGLLASVVLLQGGPESSPLKRAATAPSAAAGISLQPDHRAAALQLVMDKLRPLHERPGTPRSEDWLAQHPEAGQSFAQWRAASPVIPDAQRRVIYVQPLGTFTRSQMRIVTLTADYLARFFNLPVKLREPLPLSLIPARAQRVNMQSGTAQLLTSYILNAVLKPRLPDDAMAYIAFTASDLWPGEGWNFVFGQATLRDRVGVWSIQRNGNPDESLAAFQLALLRTLKIAVHETGHMFSIAHCTAYRCVMAGTNSLEETDHAPLWLCPECMAKIAWATHADPVLRYRRLAQFCDAQGLQKEATFFRRSARVIEAQARSR